MQTDGREALAAAAPLSDPSAASEELRLRSATLQHLLPFHLVWDDTGTIRTASDALLRLWKLKEPPPGVFLQRPFRSRLEAWMFPELTRMVLTIAAPETATCPLRGELIHIDPDRWIFTGVPTLGRVSDLGEAGLQLSDLPLHTGFGDALIATEAALTSLELSEAERQRLDAANRLLTAVDSALGTSPSGARSEAYFRALIETSSDITWILDERGIIRYASPSVRHLLDRNPRSLVGTAISSLIEPADVPRIMAAIKEVVLSGSTRTPVLFRCPGTEGHGRHLEAVGKVLGEESGVAQVVMTARDVTDRILLEQRLRQSQRMESIGRLAGGVAHDFNNILTVIRGHASLMQMSRNRSEDDAESIREILVASGRAAILTRQLLTFSRRQVLRTRTLDLGRIVEGMTSMLRRILGEDLLIEVEIAAGPLVIHGDESMFEQVLMALSANSRDAMPEGGRLLIHVSPVTVDGSGPRSSPDARVGRFIRVTVADTGAGISRENLERLFEPFFTTKEFGQGTGLGLATVHGILKLHGGWVEVESEVGRGTVFRCYWPAADPEATESDAQGDGGGIRDSLQERGRSGSILVVEDEEPLRLLVVEILQRRGYEVIAAGSGSEALRIWPAHKDKVRLLLTDIVMPDGVSGWELAGRLQADTPELVVVYTSGYSPESVDEDGRLLEGQVFLQKPYDPEVLAQVILDCMPRK